MAANFDPLRQVTLALSQPQPGVVSIGVGSLTVNFELNELLDIYNNRSLDQLEIFVLCQMCVILQQAGLSPGTATLAQMKTAIEAQKVWV